MSRDKAELCAGGLFRLNSLGGIVVHFVYVGVLVGAPEFELLVVVSWVGWCAHTHTHTKSTNDWFKFGRPHHETHTLSNYDGSNYDR